MPSEPLVFGYASQRERVEQRLDELGDLDRHVEGHTFRWVEIEQNSIRPLRFVGAGQPGVHVDAAHVHHPEQCKLVVHERVADRARPLPIAGARGKGRVGIQDGMWDGASFWKKWPPSIPSG